VRDSPVALCNVIAEAELLVTVPLKVVPSFNETVACWPAGVFVPLPHPHNNKHASTSAGSALMMYPSVANVNAYATAILMLT
jgi:hypothetical protein